MRESGSKPQSANAETNHLCLIDNATSDSITVMNEMAKTDFNHGRRLSWRRIAVGAVIGLGIVWLATFLCYRDPGRAKAIAIYDAMQPGMHNSKLFELLDREGLTWTGLKTGGFLVIDKRFYLHYDFDDKEHLCKKWMYESSTNRTELPIWLQALAWKVGIETGPLYRSWP